MTKKILRDGDNLGDAFYVRMEVFVKEQGFSEELEFDDIDAKASHVVLYDKDKPVASGRAFELEDKPCEYKLGRIAVMKPYRGTGLGLELMDALEEAVLRHGGHTVVLGAQCRARGFYEKCGYEAFGKVYLEENCPHIYMRKTLGKSRQSCERGLMGVIFDLDGVIVSTDKHHYLAWKQIADEENIRFDEKINERLRGVSRMESLDVILERAERTYTLDEKQALADEKNSRYLESLQNLDSKDILPGVIDVIKQIKALGMKVAVGSSSRNAGFILDKIGLSGFFDTVVSGNDITRSKPDPEVFLTAAKRLSLKPSECVVVEDAVSGVDAAISAGMAAVAVGGAAGYAKADYSLLRLDGLLCLELFKTGRQVENRKIIKLNDLI